MYCGDKNKIKEKRSEAAGHSLPAKQSIKKLNCPPQEEEDGGFRKRSDRVKQDSKRELLTLGPGCMMSKAAEFAHRM